MDALQPTSHSASAMPTDSEVKLDQKSIGLQIRSIDATQIELIGMKIIEAVANNLGPVGKARVMQKCQEKKGTPLEGFEEKMARMMMLGANDYLAKNGRKPFLSDMKFCQFSMIALWRVKDEITQSFSMPELFSDRGLFFQVSDYEPMGFLQTTAKEMKLGLTICDIPSKYTVVLSLDKEETQKKGELVFSLKERSDGVEFSNTTFTIKELETDFSKALESALHP